MSVDTKTEDLGVVDFKLLILLDSESHYSMSVYRKDIYRLQALGNEVLVDETIWVEDDFFYCEQKFKSQDDVLRAFEERLKATFIT
ncbi:hypothetical protein [Ignatzschineria sp. LJL83]